MNKIRLAKTKDSRTRKRAAKTINVAEAEGLKQELKSQQEFTKYLLLKGYSTSTTKRYVRDAETFIKWAEKQNIPIENTGYADVLHYVQGKRNNVKQRTVSTNINSLKHYFNFLAITDQSLENPTTQIQIKGVKRKTLYHILSKPELESLFNNFQIPDEEGDPNKNHNWFKTSVLASKRNKIILGLIIYQGLNVHELGELTQKDLKLRQGKIYIAGSRRSNQRELKLEAHQMLDIMEYTLKTRNEILKIKARKIGESKANGNPDAKPSGQSDKLFISAGESEHFRSIIQKLTKKLNQQNSKITSIQQIRASVITHWLKIHNLRQVQYMAGHRYVSSTEAYLINDLDDLQEDIAKYHPLA